jgi:carboxypeptidase Taq
VLRFELETALFNGDLEAAGLETAWNEGMLANLGIVPATPSEGYLQDVHWSCGLLGYFPTYTLGNLRAAQLFETALRQLPGLKTDIGLGKFSGLKHWLGEKIHVHGRRYSGDELMQAVTGVETSVAPFMAYLKEKYRTLYGASL